MPYHIDKWVLVFMTTMLSAVYWHKPALYAATMFLISFAAVWIGAYHIHSRVLSRKKSVNQVKENLW